MPRVLFCLFLLLGLNLMAGNQAGSAGVRVNPYFVDLEEKSEKRYAIHLQENDFQSGGQYQDFNSIIVDSRIKVALERLRKTAIEENKYIIFDFNNLEEETDSKRVKTVNRRVKKNEERHEYEHVTNNRFYTINHVERNQNFHNVFSLSEEAMPTVEFVRYEKSGMQKIPERNCCFSTAKAKGYYFTQNGTSRKLLVAHMDKEIANTLEAIFKDKNITHIDVSQYAEQAMDKGVIPQFIFRLPVALQNPTAYASQELSDYPLPQE